MGFKAVKEHYGIRHIVMRHPDGVAIGSGYISDIIVVAPDGKILKRDDGRGNKDIARYQKDIDEDPAKFAELFAREDVFERSLAVYTFSGGDIVECFCEELGYPNLTHDGDVQYENRHSDNVPKVVAWAKIDAALGVRYSKRHIRDLEDRLRVERERLGRHVADLDKLDADHPDVEIDEDYRQDEENDA
jgi:hypothetical protein